MNAEKYFLILLLLLSTATLKSQNYGIKGGLSMSNLATKAANINDNRTKPGFTFGVFRRVEGGVLDFQSEILYTRKGAQYQDNNNGAEISTNLDYLEIPILISTSFSDSPISAYLGGYGAYLLRANYNYGFEARGDNQLAIDDLEGFNRLDFGLLGGLSVIVGRLQLDARFTRGFASIEDEDRVIDTLIFAPNNIKNFGFSLSLGIAL